MYCLCIRHIGAHVASHSLIPVVLGQFTMLLNLTDYAEKLKKEAKVCYKEKITLIKGVDPFVGNVTEGELFDGYPPVEDCDLVSYLVLQTSFITMSQFKARKGLDAYNQFVCGWIKEVKKRKIADKYLTCGQVSYPAYIYHVFPGMPAPLPGVTTSLN